MSSTVLREAHARARAAWPGVELSADQLLEAVRTVAGDRPVEEVLPELQIGDLYLASSCLRGDRAALDAFETAFAGSVNQTLSQFDLSDAERKDIAQGLRVSFFVKRSLAGYSARGALRGWVRSATSRAALTLLAARKQRHDDSDEILGNLPATGDPELDLLRERFLAEFRSAFAATLASLEDTDRALLAQHYIDDLSIDQLAAFHGVHRATAARWIVRLRTALLEGTKTRLQESLDLDAPTYSSLMRAAVSRLDVSVFRLLQRPPI